MADEELTPEETPEENAGESSDPALEACKSYMRVDGDDDNALITSFMAAAKEYLANAGIIEPETPSPLYTLAVHSLTLHYYDHRDAVGGEAPLPLGLRPIINQLKHVGAAPL